jgi:Lipid A 3-O-deacylase (PagL)
MPGDNARVEETRLRWLLGVLELLPVLVLFVLVATIGPATVHGQSNTESTAQTTQNSDSRIQRGMNEFGVLGGISFHAPTLWGTTENARFGNITFRYGRVLAANKSVAFEWTIDGSPLAVLSLKRLTFTQTPSGNFTVTGSRETVYGAGVSPIGLKFSFRPQRRVQPFASAAGGFLFFEKDIPVPGAARFNFNVEFSGGIQIVNSSRRSFTLGYKYQHISNGFHSPINPGIDLQMIYGGFSIFKY